MKMINRIIEPTSGSIRIEGQDVLSIGPNQLRRHIGYVIHQIGLFRTWPSPRTWQRCPSCWAGTQPTAERVEELLHTVQLDPAEFEHPFPRQLSGCQQQRVGSRVPWPLTRR